MQVLRLRQGIDFVPNKYTGIIEWSNSETSFYKEGKLHRENGPAIEFLNGTKYWYIEGKIHREDGPAFITSKGTKEWWIEGKFHRIDGPAVELLGGYKQWFLNGKEYRALDLITFIKNEVFLSKEIGKYGLVWYRFFTEEGIKEVPLIPGMAIPIEE